jgi:anti-sigma-K factor RskA
MSDTNAREDRDLFAAEYVLGVLSAAERRQAERRLEVDLAFAREVAFWEERLGGLANAIPLVQPPLDGWQRIEAAVARAEKERKRSAGLWNNLALWRNLAIGSASVALASIAALIAVTLAPTPSGEPLLARLDIEGGEVGFVAAANPGDKTLAIVPAALLDGRTQPTSFELWVIPPGGTPHSLGLVDPSHAVKVVVPPELWPHVSADSVLAITVEPKGGSPTGQPTGPIIANGKLAQL